MSQKRSHSTNSSHTTESNDSSSTNSQEGTARHRKIEAQRRELEQRLLKELSSLVSHWHGQSSAKLTQLNVLQFAKDLLEKINREHENQEVFSSFLTADEYQFLNLEANNTFIFITTIQNGLLKICYVNDSISRILHYEPEQWFNQNFLSFIHQDDLHLFQYQMMSLTQQPNQKLSLKCRLKRGDERHSYIPINIDGVIKKLNNDFKPVTEDNLGDYLFIGIGHLSLISEYNDKNMSLYKTNSSVLFSCRCSPNDWKIFIVDSSTTTLPLVSFETFRNRSILDFIDQQDQTIIYEKLTEAISTGIDDIAPCQFIHPLTGVYSTILDIKPCINSSRPESNFLELKFTKPEDYDISNILP